MPVKSIPLYSSTQLLAIEMRDDKEITGITLGKRDKNITNYSNKHTRKDNDDN